MEQMRSGLEFPLKYKFQTIPKLKLLDMRSSARQCSETLEVSVGTPGY